MSWNPDNYGYGSADDSYSGAGSYGQVKRPLSPAADQSFKKPRPYSTPSTGPTSWDEVGGSDNGFTDFDSGTTSWDQTNSTPTDAGTSWDDDSESWHDDTSGPTSWDQVSVEPKSRGAARGGGGNRGKGRGRGSSMSWGNFGSSYDNGYFGGGGRGKGPRGGFGGRGGGWDWGWGGGRGPYFGGPFRGRGGRMGRPGPRGGFRGRGAGSKAGGLPKNLSLVDKFVRFANYLKKEGVPVNAIQSIENGVTATALGLKTEYEEEALPRIYNRPLFTGKLSLSGIYLARSLGANKKILKHEVYNDALKVLTEKTISEINDLRDPGMASIKTTVEMYLKEDIKGLASSLRISMDDIAAKLKEKLKTLDSLQTGLQKLVAYLKTTENLPDNPISIVEQGIQASKCGLPHTFECVEERVKEDEKKYVGAFMLGEHCVARAEDNMKKQCKQETYQQALDALQNKSLEDLLISVPDPNAEDADPQEDETAAPTVTSDKMDETAVVKNKPSIKTESVQARLKEFMKILLTTAFQEDNIHNMDNLASHYGLTIMCLYRKESPVSDKCSGCELYIENYLIASGVGPTKKECLLEAYNRAWEVLTTSTPEDILTQHKKLNPEDSAAPSVMEVFIKGATGVHRESNLHSLRRFGLDPDDDTKKAKDMVIVECSDWHRDRKFNAFCILQYSATANGMLLQWSCQTIQNKYRPNYRFERKMSDRLKLTLYLQKEEIGESMGPGKNRVRNHAAAVALFKMYETHDVVRVMKLKDEDRWIPWEQIEEESNVLRKKAGQPPKKETVFEGWDRQVDEYLVTTIKGHISKFFPRDDAEELLFGPGIPDKEIKVIQAYALSLKLRCDTRQFNEEPYLVIYVRQDMQKVVKELKARKGGVYGKYTLVPKEELPSSEGPKTKK